MSVTLFEQRGETSRFSAARFDAEGDLVLTCQDVGAAAREHWGDSDYEVFVTVEQKHQQRLMLALLQQVFGGRFGALDEFRAWAEERGIPTRFQSWV